MAYLSNPHPTPACESQTSTAGPLLLPYPLVALRGELFVMDVLELPGALDLIKK